MDWYELPDRLGPQYSIAEGPKGFLDHDPELVRLAGKLIGLYAAIDIATMAFITTCLGTDYLTAADMLIELDTNPSVRKRITKVIAKSRFRDAPEDGTAVVTVLSRVWHTEQIRKRVAHDYWARAPSHPDVMILVPSRSMVDVHGARRLLREIVEPVETPPGGGTLGYHPGDDFPAERLHYTKAVCCDRPLLERHVRHFHKTLMLVGLIERLASRDDEESSRARTRLSSEL